jgi:hypothetical protein
VDLSVGQNRGHACAHRTMAGAQRALTFDQGRLSYVDARYVGDGVQRAGHPCKRDLQITSAYHSHLLTYSDATLKPEF